MHPAPLLLTALLAAAPATQKERAPALRTVTARRLARFPVPRAWKLTEAWKEPAPSATAETLTADGPASLTVRFYPDGNPEFPSLDAFIEQAARPNAEFEKTVDPPSTATVAGQPARWLHLSRLDLVPAAARGGRRGRVVQDVVGADYAGGFFVVTLTTPEAAYPQARAHLDRLVRGFVLLAKPKPAPLPAPTTPQAPTPAP